MQLLSRKELEYVRKLVRKAGGDVTVVRLAALAVAGERPTPKDREAALSKQIDEIVKRRRTAESPLPVPDIG